jgi:hypothetical protein
MAPWKLPLVVAGIAVPVAFAFALGGGAAGVAAGALVATAIVVVAVRQRPLGPIGATPAEDDARRVLLVLTCSVEEPADVRRLLAEAGLDGGRTSVDVLVLSPARIGFLDRWASDVEGAREAAQRNLVATVAALAKAGVVAEARVGDEDVVQAVEDQLQSFAASEVVLVVEAGVADHAAAATELEARLRSQFRRVELSGG